MLLTFSGCFGPKALAPSVTNAELAREQELQRSLAAKEELQIQKEAQKRRLGYMERLYRISNRIFEGGLDYCGQLSDKPSTCIYKIGLDTRKEANTSPNAYADGQHIIVNEAMMEFVKSDEELALVIAHEFAHNMLSHVEQQQGNAAIGMIFGAIIDGILASENGTSDYTFTKLGAEIGSGAYSQSRETEADYIGLYVMQAAAYDISKAPELWRRMAVRNPNAIYLASTHPTTAERFVALEKTVSQINSNKAAKLPVQPQLKE